MEPANSFRRYGGYDLLSRWHERLKNHPNASAALLTLFTFIVYRGALHNSFVYDDEPQLLANPFVYNPHFWKRIFTGSVWSFNTSIGLDNFYRPLQIFYYWLVYRLAGPNPVVFHLLQVLFYAATAWLVYRLGCEILGHQSAAMLGAALWVLHPLHVEPVTWISGLPDVGCGFFVLLGFLLFVRAEKAERPGLRAHVVAALAYFPSLFFKEPAIIFPALAVTYWFFLAARSSVSAARRWAERALRLAPYLACIGVYLAIRITVLGAFSKTPSLWRISFRTLVSAVALLGQHARLLVLPLRLSIFRTFELEPSLLSPWPWIAAMVLAVAIWFRKRDAQMTFLVAWWGVALIPCLDIRQLSAPQVADRFSYIPSVGPCLALSLALLVRLPERKRGSQLVRIVAPAVALLMIFWAIQTVSLIPHWRNKETLIAYGLAQSPKAPVLHIVRGDILRFQAGDLDGAAREYQTALTLNDQAVVRSRQVAYDSYFGLGGIAQMRGHDEQALSYYRRASEILPEASNAWDALGAYYFPRGDYATAAPYFVRAVKANPQDVVAHMYLGHCWMKLGKLKEAVEEFRAARSVDPSIKAAYVSEARALAAQGDAARAAKVLASYQGQ